MEIPCLILPITSRETATLLLCLLAMAIVSIPNNFCTRPTMLPARADEVIEQMRPLSNGKKYGDCASL